MKNTFFSLVLALIFALSTSCGSKGNGNSQFYDFGTSVSLNDCPAQGTPVLNQPLVGAFPSAINYIIPLGNLNPTAGHTFPTAHTYWYYNQQTDILAPANIQVTNVRKSKTFNGDGSVRATDYSISFYVCNQIFGYYFHVNALAPVLSGETAEWDSCSTSSNGDGTTVENCYKLMNVNIAQGHPVGNTGSATSGIFDFGLRDNRTTLNFVNASRYSSPWNHNNAVCPMDYYDATTKNSMYALFADGGGNPANSCGSVAQDLAGTIQGNWVVSGTSGQGAWKDNLAFVNTNVDPYKAAVSVGGTIKSNAGYQTFTANSSGTYNLDFALTQVGPIYCYSTTDANRYLSGGRILAQLTDSEHLKVQWQEVPPSALSDPCGGTQAFKTGGDKAASEIDPTIYVR